MKRSPTPVAAGAQADAAVHLVVLALLALLGAAQLRAMLRTDAPEKRPGRWAPPWPRSYASEERNNLIGV